MKIEVTLEDIDRGIQGHCMLCPVALALKRQCPQYKSVTVKSSRVFFWANDFSFSQMEYKPVGDATAELPLEVCEFISKFDLKKEVKPFEFELEIEAIKNPIFRTDGKQSGEIG